MIKQKFDQIVSDKNIKIINIIDRDNKILKNNKSIKREYECQFLCERCGSENIKVIRQIVEKTGFFCKRCTKKNSCSKMGKISWSKKKIGHYFNAVIIIYNLKLSHRKGNWVIPEYNWWRVYSSRWCGAISQYKVKFQELLKIHDSNTKNIFRNEKELIDKLTKIYQQEGISGLTPHSLDKNHTNIYNHFIRKHSERFKLDSQNLVIIGGSGKKNGVLGCPSYWICQQLNILNERKSYLNKLNVNKSDKELIEIIKGQKKIFNNKSQIEISDYTTEMLHLSKRNKREYNLSFFREILDFPNKGFPTRDGKFVCRSRSEYLFYHHLIRYLGIKKVEYECKIYKNKRSSIDWLFELEIGQKIGVEIWGHSLEDRSTLEKRKERYLIARKEKEKEWMEISHITFYGIEWEDCQNDKKMKNFFEKRLGLTENTQANDTFIITLPEEKQFYKEMDEIYQKNGYISSMLLNSSQKHRNQRYFGKSLNGLLDKMGIDKKRNQELINLNSAREQYETKRNNSYKQAIEKCTQIVHQLHIGQGGKIRVNQALFLKLSNNNKFWSNSAFKNFEILIDNYNNILNKKENIQFTIAEKEIDWEIKEVNNKYLLEAKVYEDLLKNYKCYLSTSNGISTVPFDTIINNYNLGHKVNFIRGKKSSIPCDYIEKLNKLGFVWDEKEYREDLLLSLMFDIKKYFYQNNLPIESIYQKTKTKDILDIYIYCYYFPSIGLITSQMRQNRAWNNVKRRLLKLNDNDINTICGFRI